MNLTKLTEQAKKLINKRGGMDSVKEDAAELKDIAAGKGSVEDKVEAAAGALADPGAPGDAATPPPVSPPTH